MKANMPQTGEVIAERYRVERELGAGGMGVVYLVRHLSLDRDFALKVLVPRLSMDEEYRLRFEREAKINARLDHPNVVRVHDAGDHDGLLYMVMEVLEGESLAARILHGRAFSSAEVLEIGVQLASALQAAHAMELVHRDIKPENVIVERGEQGLRYVVLDFGLAFIADSDELGRMTRDGSVSGTPLYMSPEQISQEPIDGATDIYSLGCMLFELLAGSTPFEEERVSTVRLMSRHIFMKPPTLRSYGLSEDLPAALEELVLAMLAKEPGGRPTASQVRARLEAIRGGEVPERGEQALASRAARMVAEAPPRGEDPTVQLPLPRRSGRARARRHTLGVWGGQLDEDHQLGLATQGVATLGVVSVEGLRPCDAVLVLEAELDADRGAGRALPRHRAGRAGGRRAHLRAPARRRRRGRPAHLPGRRPRPEGAARRASKPAQENIRIERLG